MPGIDYDRFLHSFYQVVKEVLEFDQPWLPIPLYNSFMNNLYISPCEVSLTTSKAKVKSIAVRTCLLPGPPPPGSPSGGALPAVYSIAGRNFATHATTAINYEQKRTLLSDEVKIKLPILMSDAHRVVFEFWSVDTKILTKKKDDVPVEVRFEFGAVVSGKGTTYWSLPSWEQTLVGYATLPLMKGGHILHDGEYTLPIELVGAGPDAPAEALDSEKAFIRVRTRCVSSLYPQHEKVAALFRGISRGFDDWQDVRSSLLF